MRVWISRLADWFRRDALERELTEELRLHRSLLEHDATTDGASPEDARRDAGRRLGNTTSVRESAREVWSIPSLEHFLQDVRYALRGLRRSPVFTATVVVTLGLGIGANATMFNVVDRLMFRPLAYLRDPATVHRIYWQWTERGTEITSQSIQYARYLDLQKLTKSFSQFAGFAELNVAVGEGEASRERRIGAVSASFFDFFDARPPLGRFFDASEDVIPTGADVVVLAYAFWKSEFGGRDVRGKRLQVGNTRATIIGVAPEGFNGVNDANPPVLYIPITTFAASTGTNDAKTYFSKYQWGWMHVMVRRRPNVTRERAEADATVAFRQSWIAGLADNPTAPSVESARPRIVVSSVRPGAGPDPALEARTALWVTVVATIVLLIACANVGNRLLARALRRRRETAIRLALGVSQARLLLQSLTETLVLALIGGAVALVVAQWAGAAIRRILIAAPSAPPFADWRTLGVTAGLVIAVGLGLGLVPVVLSRRRDLARSLRGGARGGARGGVSEGARLRGTLLVLQATLSVALLVGAALFARSLDAVKSMRMGYDAERVLLVNRVVRGTFPTEAEHRAVRDALVSTAQSLGGVEAAAWVSSAPFVSTSNNAIFVDGIDSVSRLGTFTYQATTPDYFRVMGTRIIRGRGLSADDRAGAQNAAVISESMAKVLWPKQDALGKCFRVRSDTVPCTIVVGVAEDMVQRDLAGSQRYHYYVSLEQYTRTWGNGLLIRTKGDPAVEGERIRQALQRVMPGSSYVTVRPLRDIVQNAQASWRLGATMFVAFAALALIVAGVGLYGVIGYSVAQRMHELGVRVALGAQQRDILWLVVGQSVRFALAGITLGVLVAVLQSRWIQPLLFHQSATDARILIGVAGTMLAVALVAATAPAIRAAGADPNSALRSE